MNYSQELPRSFATWNDLLVFAQKTNQTNGTDVWVNELERPISLQTIGQQPIESKKMRFSLSEILKKSIDEYRLKEKLAFDTDQLRRLLDLIHAGMSTLAYQNSMSPFYYEVLGKVETLYEITRDEEYQRKVCVTGFKRTA